MYSARTFDGLPALLWNGLLAANERTGTVEGANVSLSTSTTAITFNVAAGTVRIGSVTGGGTVTVAAQTVTLDPNPYQDPRRDVIWIDSTGTAQVRKGNPEPYQPTRDPDGDYVNERPARMTFRPAPDDMGDVLQPDGGAPIGTVQATVIVPPGANDSNDLTDDDWTDRRTTVAAAATAGSHDALSDVSLEDHQPQRYAGTNLVEVAGNFNVIDAVDGGTIDADSVDGYDIYVQNTAPTTTDPYLRFEDA